MMITLHQWIMPAVTAVSVVMSMTQAGLQFTARSRRRTQELVRVGEMLPEHYEAVEAVLASDALTPEMKELVGWVSESIEDRALACYIAKAICDPAFMQRPIRSSSEAFRIELLRTTHPEDADAFDRAMSTGFLAALLRWPETAGKADMVMSRLFTSSKIEVARAVTSAHAKRVGVIGPSLPFGAVPAI